MKEVKFKELSKVSGGVEFCCLPLLPCRPIVPRPWPTSPLTKSPRWSRTPTTAKRL